MIFHQVCSLSGVVEEGGQGYGLSGNSNVLWYDNSHITNFLPSDLGFLPFYHPLFLPFPPHSPLPPPPSSSLPPCTRWTGFIGLFDFILLFPLLVIWHFVGIETFEVPPTPNIWTLLLVNGLAGTVISELLWLW